MENYLMSSPRNQQFDYDYQNFDMTLDNYELKDQLDMNLHASMNLGISGVNSDSNPGNSEAGIAIRDFHPHNDTSGVGNSSGGNHGGDQEDSHDSTGEDLNSGMMQFGDMSHYYENDYNDMSRFQQSKNVFLADNMNLSKHQSNLSISSTQDLYSKAKITNSNSIDSIPPLTSSISNQSLLESPNSFKRPPLSNPNSQSMPPSLQAKIPGPSSSQNDPSQQLMTPRKLTRNKSLSIGSYNLSTPFKTNPSPTASTPNPNSVNNKITKTPYKHSRSLSRSRMDKSVNVNLNPFYTPISNQGSGGPGHNRTHSYTQSHSSVPNSAASNGTGSFISPKYDDGLSFDNDDFQTPLQPNNQSSINPNLPQFSLPNYSSPQYSLNNAHPPLVPQQYHQLPGQEPPMAQQPMQSLQFQAQPARPNYKFSPSLRRQNTLDSIKIEDQDDDAFKQLKRAKSFNNFRPLSAGVLDSSHGEQMGVHGSNSPHYLENQHFGQSISQPTSSTQLQLNLQKLSMISPEAEMTPKHEGIGNDNNSKSLNNIQLIQSQFNNLKSYPATVNLASIAHENEGNNDPNDGYFKPINGLLPPMTSFNQAHNSQSNSAPATASSTSFAQSPISVPPPSLASVAVSRSASGSESGPASASASTPNSFGSGSYNESSLVTSNKNARNPGSSSKHIQVSESNLQIAKEINPEFVPDLPIKLNDKAATIQDPKKKHACPLCFARFQRPEHVKRHMKSHSLEKPFECDQPNCGKRFNRKDNLKAHLKKIHSLI